MKNSIESKKERLKSIVWQIGRRYSIDPKDESKGVEICRNFHEKGLRTTLGKFSKNGIDIPEAIVGEYRKCSDSIADSKADHLFYLSVKPPALEFNLAHIKNITVTALKNGHGIHFDSHDHYQAEATFRLLKQSMRHFETAPKRNCRWFWGVTLPSRWKRSFADMRWALDHNVRVRLVKGEFKAADPSEETNPEKGFLELLDGLAGNTPELAVATHDYHLAREAMGRAKSKGTRVELELLFGMPSAKMVALAKEMKVPLRFYIAYGEALLLYGLRHLLLNPHKFFRPHLKELFGNHQRKTATIMNAL